MRGRFERRCGQRSVKVRFVEPGDTQTAGESIVTEPAERELVARGEDGDSVRGGVPLAGQRRERHGELDGGVNGLARLDAGRKIGTGHDVQTLGALPVSHRPDVSASWSTLPAVDWWAAGLWGLCGGATIELVDLYKLVRTTDGGYQLPPGGADFRRAYGIAVSIRLVLGFIAAAALAAQLGGPPAALGAGAGATGFFEHLGRPSRPPHG